MAADYYQFTGVFAEFNDRTRFPEALVNFWLTTSYSRLDPNRLRDQLDLAAMLMTAHYVTLSARQTAAAQAGDLPGDVRGPVSSESVGAVSVSYSEATNIDNAGAWNGTTYGQELYAILRPAMMGGIYVPGRSYRRLR